MSGISLSPKRALAYPGTRLAFVDESSVSYCFGSAVRITHLLPDKGDGDGECLWEENEWAGMSAVAANWRAGRLAVCPAGRINPAIHLYSYPGMVLRGTLLGGTDLRYTDVAFSRDGARVAAFGNRTDHLATVWNVKKASADEEELTGEKVVEAVLPGDMSFLSFNPADADQLCIGGPSGLYFWRVDNLVDNWVISPTKARAPAPPGRGKRNLFGEEDHPESDDIFTDPNTLGTAENVGSTSVDGQALPGAAHTRGAASAPSRSPTADGSRPETADAAGAVAAAEIVQLESLVTMGDGKHDYFTCHCWGLEGTLWAINEPGQLACFDANTGKYTSCMTLSRASGTSDGGWTAVGLLMTKTHVVVTGSDGSIEWLALPTQPGGSLDAEFSIQLLCDDNSPCPAVAMACSPLYDKMVVGSSNGSLHSVFVDIERHVSEPAVPASGVNSLRTFHKGKVVALTCLRPLSKEIGESGGVLVTGAGEDGAIRVWTTDRGKLCGTQTFSAFSEVEKLDEAIEGSRRASLDDRMDALEDNGEAARGKGDISVPVCALASCRAQPLIAVGLCHGAVHIVFVKETSAYDVDMASLWSEHFYHGPASQLCFHPTKTLLAVASADDRAVHVINFHNSMGDFVVCGVGVAPPGQGGVNGLMWRGNDIVFSTEDCLVCALPVKSERRARPTRADPLTWVLRTPTPLHGMRPHPQIRHGPFFAVSADMRVLQVLPTLPEKGIPSTVDGGEPKAMSPLDTLEAHQKGAAVMAASPDGRFMATGGADGLVCLWMVYENQVELLNSALVHAGPVISLAFAANSAHLFTTSLDGTVFGLALEGLQEGSGVQPPPVVATLERLADRRTATQKMRGGIIERLGGEIWRQESTAEVRDSANIELDAVGKAQRKVVGEFKQRLARLIDKNETLPELEKMERSEFVVDVAGRDRKVAANEAAAKKLGEDIRKRNLGKELIGSRIRIECWDSMEVQKKEVWRIQPDGVFVENFAIRRRSPEELARIAKVKQLRALELRDVRRGTYSASRAWPGLLDEVPADISWMVNEGQLAPVVDVVQALRDEAAGAGKGAGGKGGGAAEDIATTGRNKSATQKEAIVTLLLSQDDDGSDGEDKDEEETEDPIAVLEVLEAADETDPTYLLYPPLALRTPRQKRTQIVLLGELVLDVQRAFNRHLDRLHSAKEDCMDKAREHPFRCLTPFSAVEEKNNRIQEILVDLGSDETFFRPQWLDAEQPEEVFNVESDMTVQPYESEADREARRKAEEEKRRREEEAKGSNDKFRALDDMMHGTLEVKQDALTADAVKKPEWMDEVAAEDMTEEQKKEAEDYETKLKEVQEEQATYRKALELELKKLRTEVADLVKAFDDRVKEMGDLRVQVQMFIASQELLLTRLAMGIVEREDDDVTMEKLDKALGDLFEKKALTQERLEGYRLHVEQSREEIEALQAEDRLMERNFKKEIQEAASNPIDMAEMMAQLVQLYKLRDHSAMSTGGSSGYRGSATGMSNATSYRKSQSSRRTQNMRESAMGRSKRKRSSRVSSGGGSMRASHGLGPLQEAMRQATKREKAAKIAEKDPFGPVDEQLDRSAASEAVNTAVMAQDLEYPGFEVEDQVWNRLLELRGIKIRKEMELKKKQRLFAVMKRKLEALQADCDSVDSQVMVIERRKRAISERAYLAEKNIEVLVKLKQGQDEVPRGAFVTDYSDSVLVPSAIVNHTNEEIRKLGGEKVRTLNKIKQFRKNINLMQWDHTYLDEQVKDREAYYTDLQLLRVTKKLQAVLKGDRGDKDKELVQKTEARVEMMERSHKSKARHEFSHELTNTLKARQANAKISQQLQERAEENRRVSGQLVQLFASVKVREAIYRSHTEASGGEVNPAQQAAGRMKRITTRRRLVDLARAQTGEIEALKAELDRLRQRTFPSFAHATRHNVCVADMR
ncbi:unnamed protein product [Pylaiella littoralis]